MKFVHCNRCGRDDTELVNRGKDLYLDRPGDFRLVRCRHCGLIYQNPQLTSDELLAYYPQESYQRYTPAMADERSLVRRTGRQHGMWRRYRWVRRHAQRENGRLLDVGCATGAFLATVRQQGWEVTGVELSPYAAQYAREKVGLDVRTGTLEEAGFAADTFHVVTMWDVFEHVADPRGTLAEVARVLRPGGLLVAAVPNPSSFEARLFGEHWAGWDRPRHLHLYTPTVLRELLAEAGFGPVTIESFSGRLGVTLLNVRYALTARGVPRERWGLWLDVLDNPAVRLITLPIYWLGEAWNQTTNMTAFAVLRDAANGQ